MHCLANFLHLSKYMDSVQPLKYIGKILIIFCQKKKKKKLNFFFKVPIFNVFSMTWALVHITSKETSEFS